jgi:hypothetical protein
MEGIEELEDMEEIEGLEGLEVIEAIEDFSFCVEITFPMLRSEFAIAHATLVMTKQSHCEYTTC